MNNKRRKELTTIHQEIEALKDRLLELQEQLETVVDEEREAFENIPENLAGSDRYERAEEAVDLLDEALEALDEAISGLDTTLENIENAQE